MQALADARGEDGTDLVRNDSLFLLSGEPLLRRAIARSTRVGVSVGIERRWRYFERRSAFVSPGRPSVPVATGAEAGTGATNSRGS